MPPGTGIQIEPPGTLCDTETLMKAQERHQLKQNEFAVTAARVAELAAVNRNRILYVVAGAVALIVIVAAVVMWRGSSANRAGAMFGVAMATAQSPVVPAPTLPGAKQQPGTFPTEQARSEAAIKAFNEVAAAYPNTEAGLAAAYQAAAELLSAGKASEAEQAFAAVAARDANGIYGPLAKLGQAQAMQAAGKTDEAIAVYTALAANRDAALPIDGVLMELGRASLKAGKTADARAAFKRVVDEFPRSPFSTDAEQRLAALN
jgi:TolA-binding protein